MFGNRGLIEHQILVPHGAVPDYLKDIAKILKQYKPLIPLYHLKLFSGDRRSISFSGTGLALALHFAADEKALKSLTEIDRVNISFGCITNLIKDSRVSRETIYEQYKHLDEFRTQLEAFSPNRTFQNLISQRLF